MLHQLHVLRQAPHGRAALAVERDDEVLAVAARRDEGAEGVVFEDAHAGEARRREALSAGEELGRVHARVAGDEEVNYFQNREILLYQ